VPRTQIAPTLLYIAETAKRHNIRISNIFHAGDGNLHPIILFNAHIPEEFERARAAGDDILRWCISVGGSITGEHGVGMEKNELMDKLFSPDSLDYMGRFKKLFDPEGRLNPGKVLPTGRGCLEIRQQPLSERTAV
jgi:glycolate oxidase